MSAIHCKKIIHIDMDCFYASIEMRDNPNLKGKPIAVGSSASQRGVLATCNYEARQFGLHSAMSTAQALKKCPQLILRPVNMPLYKQVSQQIHQIFQRYTAIIEPLSLDEAYLDVTDCKRCSGSATWIAQEIRQVIAQELNLTASAGVAPLKFLAKIASDYNKPNGQFVILPDEIPDFLKNLSLKKLPGVGKVTFEKLLKMGLQTCLDVQHSSQIILLNEFGKIGQRIWDFSHGIDSREVLAERTRKSVGVERTLLKDIHTFQQANAHLKQLYVELTQRLQKSHSAIPISRLHKLGVKLKFEDFQTTTLENSKMTFEFDCFHQLLTQIWERCQGRTVRLIGIHVDLPVPESPKSQQMTLW